MRVCVGRGGRGGGGGEEGSISGEGDGGLEEKERGRKEGGEVGYREERSHGLGRESIEIWRVKIFEGKEGEKTEDEEGVGGGGG